MHVFEFDDSGPNITNSDIIVCLIYDIIIYDFIHLCILSNQCFKHSIKVPKMYPLNNQYIACRRLGGNLLTIRKGIKVFNILHGAMQDHKSVHIRSRSRNLDTVNQISRYVQNLN